MKQYKLMEWIYRASEKIMPFVPDWVTGNTSVMNQKYRKKYGLKDCNLLIKQEKIKIMAVYLIIISIFIVILCSSVIVQLAESKEITSIQRPEYCNKNISVPVEVQLKYKNYEVTKEINLKVQQRTLSQNEKRKLLQTFSNQLDQLILGENIDLKHIQKPLNLMEQDPKTGITIQWESDHPEIINDKDKVDLLKSKDNQRVGLKAEMTLDDITISKTIALHLDRNAAKGDYIRNLEQRLDVVVEQLSESKSSHNIQLPGDLESGIEVRWFIGRNDYHLLFLLFILVILIVYFKRFDRINKEIKESEESILKDLPEFMNKVVLLLNAGLVVSSAISKIVKDYEAFNYGRQLKKDLQKKRYLYEELCEIQKRVNQSNASLIKELKEFSQRSGVREFVRIIAVISDNWDKGSTMVEKLEGESELLWISRKKRAEERGRLAETKLTFPLMILLIVLIMVTIAPALMGM